MTFDAGEREHLVRSRISIDEDWNEQWEPTPPAGGCGCIRPPWLNDVPSPPEQDQLRLCRRCGRPTRHTGECLLCNAEELAGVTDDDLNRS
jgi:hypothetical protein